MATTEQPSKVMFWISWVISGVIGLFLLSGAFTALSGSEMVKQGMAPFGFMPAILPWLGATELLCSVLYLIPRTAPVGAILMSTYMGGAVVAHARIGDPLWVVSCCHGRAGVGQPAPAPAGAAQGHAWLVTFAFGRIVSAYRQRHLAFMRSIR